MTSAESDRHHYSGMHVVKRDGTRQPVAFDKITRRLMLLCDRIEPTLSSDAVDPLRVA